MKLKFRTELDAELFLNQLVIKMICNNFIMCYEIYDLLIKFRGNGHYSDLALSDYYNFTITLLRDTSECGWFEFNKVSITNLDNTEFVLNLPPFNYFVNYNIEVISSH